MVPIFILHLKPIYNYYYYLLHNFSSSEFAQSGFPSHLQLSGIQESCSEQWNELLWHWVMWQFCSSELSGHWDFPSHFQEIGKQRFPCLQVNSSKLQVQEAEKIILFFVINNIIIYNFLIINYLPQSASSLPSLQLLIPSQTRCLFKHCPLAHWKIIINYLFRNLSNILLVLT